MTVRRSSYWDTRCERWGAWRVGARGVKVATWATLRVASDSLANWPLSDEAVPELHLVERETHELVLHLAERAATADLARFALAAYPRSSRLSAKLGIDRRALAERYLRLHRHLARLLDQRRRGEPLDATRRPDRGRTVTVRTQAPRAKRPRAVASVVTDRA